MENLRVKFIPVDIILAENLVSAPISKKGPLLAGAVHNDQCERGAALGAYLGNINIGITAESFPNTLRSFILPHFSQGRNGKLRVQLR